MMQLLALPKAASLLGIDLAWSSEGKDSPKQPNPPTRSHSRRLNGVLVVAGNISANYARPLTALSFALPGSEGRQLQPPAHCSQSQQ